MAWVYVPIGTDTVTISGIGVAATSPLPAASDTLIFSPTAAQVIANYSPSIGTPADQWMSLFDPTIFAALFSFGFFLVCLSNGTGYFVGVLLSMLKNR